MKRHFAYLALVPTILLGSWSTAIAEDEDLNTIILDPLETAPTPSPIPTVTPGETVNQTTPTSTPQQPPKPKKPRVKKKITRVRRALPPPAPIFQYKEPEVSFDARLENILTASYVYLDTDYAKQTRNQLLIPYAIVREEAKPSISLKLAKQFTLTGRPVASVQHSRAMKSDTHEYLNTEVSARWNELFGVFRASDSVMLTGGRHNFQWGTSELSSASNWIFRSTSFADSLGKNPLTESEARDLIRFNLSDGQLLNLVLMTEYEKPQTANPVGPKHDDPSGKRFLGKIELAWNSGANFFGLVGGGSENTDRPFVGEYAGVDITDALFFYADIGHATGSDAYYPVRDSITIPYLGTRRFLNFRQVEAGSRKVFTLGVAGLRYTFEGGTEIKLEYMYNEAGYTKKQLDLAKTIPDENPGLYPFWISPNMEYRSKHAALLALRSTNFGPGDKMNLILRYFKPFSPAENKPEGDESGSVFFYWDYAWSDNAIAFLLAGGFHGEKISEAALPYRALISIGQKYAW